MLGINANRSCLAVILICAFVSGCVFRPVYGDSWAEQVQVDSGECPVIDGDYQNSGEEIGKGKDDSQVRLPHSLTHQLNGWGIDTLKERQANPRLGTTDDDPAKDPYQTVSLRLVDGKLHIEATLADGSTRAFDLPTRQRCRDSTVPLEAFSPWDGGPVYRHVNLALGRAEDGSLLMYRTSTGVVSILGPNWVYHAAVWIRFPSVAPTTD